MRIDGHCDSICHLRQHASLRQLELAHLDYQRLCQHLDISFFALFLDEKELGERIYEECRFLLRRLQEDLADQAGLELLLRRGQLAEAGKYILLGLEGGRPLGEKLEFLPEYYAAGLRFIGLTWNYRNQLAGGAWEGGGLSALGRDLVAEANRLGILLDGAHLAEASFWDLLQESQKPLIISHTGCAALQPHPRNLTDDQLRAVAEQGGVAGIYYVADFLQADHQDGPLLDIICAHIRHAVQVAGVAHVGLGSDFDGCQLPPDLAGLQSLPQLLERLHAHGFKPAEIDLIAGDNFARVLREVLPAQ